MPRKQLTVLQRLKIAEDQKWTCAMCNDLLNAAFEIDHLIPYALVGENTALQALCSNCHAFKSRSEQSHIYFVKTQLRRVSESKFSKWWSVCAACGSIYDHRWFQPHACGTE